jgi:MAC/Perforin domain
MPLIDVKRDDQAIAAETVDNPVATTLTAFREKLGSRMLSSEEFLSKGGTPIETIIQEDGVTVADIAENGVVKIRMKPKPAGPVSIRVVKEGKSNPVQARVEDLLSDFRKQVSSLSPSLIAENERFQEKDVAGSSFTLASEKAFKVKDAIDKDQQIKIVLASPKRNITIQKGTSSQSFPEVEESQSLLQFKKYVVVNGGMVASDIFLVGGADVKDEQAGKISVAQAADKDNKIMIKAGGPVLGNDPVTVSPTDPTKNLRDWSQTISYGTPEYPLPTKFAGKAPTREDPEDKWSALKDNEKQYVFSVRQLGSAIVFPKAAVDGEKLSAELTKADARAVSISVAQPGVKEQNLTAQSSFLMTYSQVVHELRKRSATNVSASVGAKGAAVKGGFTTSNMEINQTDRSKIYMTQLIYKPAVQLYFDENKDIVATDAFKAAIKLAVDQSVADDPFTSRTRYYEILSVLAKYGHFVPTRFMLGGAFIIEEVAEVTKTGNISEQSTSFSGGVEATIKGVTTAVEFGNTEEVKKLTTNLSKQQSIKISAIGGDTGAFSSNDPGPWLQSIRYSRYWAVIDYSDLTPTIRYLPPDLLRQCLDLIKLHWADPQTEERTTLNMLEYATIAESKLIASEAPNDARKIYGGRVL